MASNKKGERMHAPDFVVGTGVAASAVAGAAHDALLKDGLHLDRVFRSAEGTDGLREGRRGGRQQDRAEAHLL